MVLDSHTRGALQQDPHRRGPAGARSLACLPRELSNALPVGSMDLSKEVAGIKLLLQDEAAGRRILEEWINTSLKATLEKHHQELKRLSLLYESKIAVLETELEKEITARKKLTQWIKDNFGPSLEAAPFKDAVRSISRPRSNSASDTPSTPTPVPVATKSPASWTLKKTPAKTRTPSKKLDQEAEDSPWSDEEPEDEAPTSARGPPSAPSSTKSVGKFAAAGVSSSSSSQVHPAMRSRVQKLAALEASVFGTDDVTDFTFPSGDATIKTNKNRMEYYLNNQKQATNSYAYPTLLDRTMLFTQKGVKVVFAPLNEVDMKRDSFNFAILTNDRVFPICTDGLIRSQILYLVLQAIKRKLGVQTGLELPHGARYGFDPYLLQDHTTDQRQQFAHFPAPKAGKEIVAFKEAFGVDKVPRFGQDSAGVHQFHFSYDKAAKKMSDSELDEIGKQRRRMREFFDLYYYGSLKATGAAGEGRTVLIAFGSAVPIVMDRLSEVNYRFDLSKVTLLALPYPTDRLKAVDTKPEDYIAAYKLYASLFTPIAE